MIYVPNLARVYAVDIRDALACADKSRDPQARREFMELAAERCEATAKALRKALELAPPE